MIAGELRVWTGKQWKNAENLYTAFRNAQAALREAEAREQQLHAHYKPDCEECPPEMTRSCPDAEDACWGCQLREAEAQRDTAKRERDALRDCGVEFGACMPPCAKHAEEVWNRWHELIDTTGRIVQKDNVIIADWRERAEAAERKVDEYRQALQAIDRADKQGDLAAIAVRALARDALREEQPLQDTNEARDAWWRERIERHVYGLLDEQAVSVGHVRTLLAPVCEHGYTPSHCAVG